MTDQSATSGKSRWTGARPFLWSGMIFLVCLALSFYAAHREKQSIEQGQIPPLPNVSAGQAGYPLVYFFAVVVLLGIVLFLIPISKLRLVLRVAFGFAFAWGSFIMFWLLLQHGPPSILSLATIAAASIAVAVGMVWLFVPRIWFHDALLVFTLVSMASVFGAIFSPWTVIIIMSFISVYDFLAVRFGYMQWMTQKLSESDTLPAFLIPKKPADWNASLKGPSLKKLFAEKAQREFSVLGGGDIGFPLLLAVSVLYTLGLAAGLTVAGFSLLGLVAAYAVHLFLMQGKPTPALPPIFALSFLGFLLVHFKLVP